MKYHNTQINSRRTNYKDSDYIPILVKACQNQPELLKEIAVINKPLAHEVKRIVGTTAGT